MENNLFIETLEIGIKKGAEGIQYDQLVNSLKDKYPQLETEFNRSFIMWFYSKFDPSKNFHDVKRAIADNHPGTLLGNYNNIISFINGDAYFQYLEYLELKEAREASLKAQRSSRNAIIISVIALAITLLFSVAESIMSFIQIRMSL